MNERRKYEPRPWQYPMLDHLAAHPRCALWAGMGMGKSSVALTALDAMYLAGESHPTLILGPLRVARKTWPDEARKWNHLRHIEVVPIVGNEKARREALRRDVAIKTINYDNLQWLVETLGDAWPFRTVVSDEATRLKNLRLSFRTSAKGTEFLAGEGGKRARALGMIAHTKIKNFIELTGTPAPNGLEDLWGQMWFLDGGQRLGRTHSGFKDRWFRPKRDGYGSEPMPHAMAQIQAAVRDLCLTIEAKDWFDVREPRVNNVYIDLPVKARAMYRDMEKEMFAQIGDRSAEAFNAAARTQKCLQFANGAVYVDPLVDSEESPRAKEWRRVHDEKIEALDSIAAEVNAPMLVCYEFKSDLARLLKAFPKGRALKTERDEDDFKAGKIPMLFLHPKSGGHGIDGFQNSCCDIVFFGHNWNLEEYQQVIERIGPVRQMQSGFDRIVNVHHIIARGTVDELVMERREGKRAVQDILLDAMKRR